MLTVEIPGHALLELEYLVLDLNGTVAVDGELVPGAGEAVAALKPSLRVVLLTADTRGNGARIAEDLGAQMRLVGRDREAESKLDVVDELGADGVVVIGNGANDELALRDAALGIAVVGGEGAAVGAVRSADVVVTSIVDALGLLTDPRRLIATLRR